MDIRLEWSAQMGWRMGRKKQSKPPLSLSKMRMLVGIFCLNHWWTKRYLRFLLTSTPSNCFRCSSVRKFIIMKCFFVKKLCQRFNSAIRLLNSWFHRPGYKFLNFQAKSQSQCCRRNCRIWPSRSGTSALSWLLSQSSFSSSDTALLTISYMARNSV